MGLILREPDAGDFDQCIALLQSPWPCDPSNYDDLRAMWRHIIESGCGATVVALDPMAPSRVIAFGFAVFVADERAQEYQQCRTPLLARRILKEWIAGRQPFLNADEVARANAGSGLNLLVTHYGRRIDSGPYENYEAARFMLSGWNLRSFTAEVCFDPQRDDREYSRFLGFDILEYPGDAIRRANIPYERRPLIWAANRQQHDWRHQYGATLLFASFAPPRLKLSPLEQHLLRLAFDGVTDRTIADNLGISVATVKKHFRRVYDRVADAGVLEGLMAEAPPDGDSRGREMRRHLLNYLRDHPEELRPYRAAPAVRQAGA
ncbi:MAG: hypothetical protein JO030_04540 [Candidatus Eremiobacteraeota bacterium]|nr:hypothetical protein [Candidatus Eremiobacteraeota bacterium]